MPNSLAHQASPYLLQHADNPVDWVPWDPAAFERARAENKPILLSIGYAACHWCHVMAHESFENPAIAAAMNADFIPVKVDREERPDVDILYQQALALTGEQGGWPLTMALTPEGVPFWGGTYFPPEDRWGRPGFPRVLAELARMWRDDPAKVAQAAGSLHQALVAPPPPNDAAGAVALSPALLDTAASQLAGHVDPVWGGLGQAPKFPMPFVFEFLWRAWKRGGDTVARDAVITTLDRMCHGGIFDHLGGGFARYATDDHWLVPHFEKMLYDNAQVIGLLTLVWQDTGSPLYAQRIAETVAWLEREMLTADGAFAATLDADSEGEEGRFYVWTAGDIDALLDPEDAALIRRVYDVRPGGNWEGRTILHRNHDGGREAVDESRLARLRGVLLDARARRERPARDDKVLADWNGLMITALAQAGTVLARPEWVALAVRAFDRVVALLCHENGRLGHAWRAGQRQDAAILDDYAALCRAALALHEATGAPRYLDQAVGWVAVVDARYWDDAAGGYFLTADDATDLITRSKIVADSAVPSGNGQMVEVLARLHLHTGDDAWRHRAERMVAALTPDAVRQFPGSATLLNGFEVLHAGVHVVIVPANHDDARDSVQALRHAALSAGEPNLVLSIIDPARPLPPGHPAAGKTAMDGAAAAYVCRGPVCAPPVRTPEALRDLLVRG